MNINIIQLSSQVTLEYVEQGKAPGTVLICLHGYTDSWKSFALVLPLLSENMHAFALSQRGHGNSDRPSEGYDPSDFATDIALFIDQLNLGAAVIVGHSMGGIIAQRFALDYPQKTKALILIDTFAGFTDNEGVAALEVAISGLNDPVDPTFVEEFQRSTVAKPVSETFMQTVVGESLKVPARTWKAVLSDLMKVNYTKELQAVKKPVLLVWGDQDTFAVRKDQDQLLAAIAGARLAVYTGAGHSVHWEEPQRFAHDLEDFLNEVVPTGSG
jgi:pimeloyl-ACP methyl ester carboxylesterase